MTAHSSLDINIGPGLAFRFDLPGSLLGRVDRFLEYYDGDIATSDEAVLITSEPPPKEHAAGHRVLEESPLIVRRSGAILTFELPEILAWCDGSQGHAGVHLRQPSDTDLDLFVGLALAPLLLELAPSRGWIGVHAAGVAVDGVGLLLPGPSGVGKSTIFTQMHRAGYEVLSDDLIWLQPQQRDWTMVAFPRGTGVEPVPASTCRSAPLKGIICPTISQRSSSRWVPLAFPDVLQALIEQGGFLSAGEPAGERFRALVQVARSAPAYRLEAGHRREGTPRLLASLVSGQLL